MIVSAARLLRCDCTDAAHEHEACPNRFVLAHRAALYADLYDGPPGPPARSRRIRLLNTAYAGDDATDRRFAQLEID